MSRIRTIKPEFPQSESIGNLSREARLLYILLWTVCDDAGRTRAASRLLASLLYPYDEDAPDLIDGWLAELERELCITLYHVDGATYLEVRKWLIHQRIDRPSASKLPSPDGALASPREPSRILDDGPGPGPGPGMEWSEERAREAKTVDNSASAVDNSTPAADPSTTQTTVTPGTETKTKTKTLLNENQKLCRTLRDHGLHVTPTDPLLVALLQQGVSTIELVALADEAAARRKSWPWVAAALNGRRRDAAALKLPPDTPWHQTRSGIERRGVELGLGTWDQEAFESGSGGELFAAYAERVYRAAGHVVEHAA